MPARGIIAAMSLDSVSSQQSAPAYRPTATVQAIGSRWGVAAGHALAAEAAAHVLGTGGPAAPAAWCMALERWGTMSFAEVATAATEHAGRGFPLSNFSAYQMTANADKYRRWATSAALYLNNGRPFRMGERLVQTELAETLARMARAEAKAGGSRAAGVRAARDEFYRGETAKRIAEYHRVEKGPLTLDDLADFEVEVERALVGTWGPWQVGVCGFWCQGPVLLQMLNLIEGTDVAALGHNSPAYLHLLAETVKVAFADREAYYGDPHFVEVPAERLLSKAYAAERRALIRDRAWREMPPVGERRGAAAIAGGSGESLDTSYVAVVDAEGNGFSATPSDPNVDAPVVGGVGARVAGLARPRPQERRRARQAPAPDAGARHAAA